jgi:teichuronopeptide biosynthesis TupA-like protein
MQVLRRRTDPDHVWRFSRYWQRTLLNKFNSREFVQRHGCRVPALYWHGRHLSELPIDSLPDCYVIRPVIGASSRRVFAVVDGHELMTDTRLDKTELRDRLRADFGEVTTEPILVEQFIHPAVRSGALPREYKFHVFGDRIAAIELQHRSGRKPKMQRQFDANWNPLPQPIHTRVEFGGAFDPPASLDEMIRCVRRLGVAFGTYVRVDYYDMAGGPVFSEFSSMPGAGKEHTRFGDDYMGRFWAEVYPREV